VCLTPQCSPLSLTYLLTYFYLYGYSTNGAFRSLVLFPATLELHTHDGRELHFFLATSRVVRGLSHKAHTHVQRHAVRATLPKSSRRRAPPRRHWHAAPVTQPSRASSAAEQRRRAAAPEVAPDSSSCGGGGATWGGEQGVGGAAVGAGGSAGGGSEAAHAAAARWQSDHASPGASAPR
jgi:hypothetical protein